MRDGLGIRQRIGDLNGNAEILQFTHDIDHPGIAGIGHVLLEGHAENRDHSAAALPAQQTPDTFAGDPAAHAVVDAAAGQDDFGVIAGLFGAVGQVIRINPDAVAPDQARIKR